MSVGVIGRRLFFSIVTASSLWYGMVCRRRQMRTKTALTESPAARMAARANALASGYHSPGGTPCLRSQSLNIATVFPSSGARIVVDTDYKTGIFADLTGQIEIWRGSFGACPWRQHASPLRILQRAEVPRDHARVEAFPAGRLARQPDI